MSEKPRLRDLLATWLVVGMQSFGGGSSTLYLMRQQLVDRHRWLTGREFTEVWALSQLSPGIHLTAMAGLIGRQLAGARGVVISVAGMLVPSAAICALLTAGYVAIDALPQTHAALQGVGPVTGGITAALAIQLAQSGVRRGWLGAGDWIIALVALAIGLSGKAPIVVVIAIAAVLGALVLKRSSPVSRTTPMG